MADTHASIGAQTAATPTDPVHALMEAINLLARCKAMLLCDEPLYRFALQNLQDAQRYIVAVARSQSPNMTLAPYA